MLISFVYLILKVSVVFLRFLKIFFEIQKVEITQIMYFPTSVPIETAV